MEWYSCKVYIFKAVVVLYLFVKFGPTFGHLEGLGLVNMFNCCLFYTVTIVIDSYSY